MDPQRLALDNAALRASWRMVSSWGWSAAGGAAGDPGREDDQGGFMMRRAQDRRTCRTRPSSARCLSVESVTLHCSGHAE